MKHVTASMFLEMGEENSILAIQALDQVQRGLSPTSELGDKIKSAITWDEVEGCAFRAERCAKGILLVNDEPPALPVGEHQSAEVSENIAETTKTVLHYFGMEEIVLFKAVHNEIRNAGEGKKRLVSANEIWLVSAHDTVAISTSHGKVAAMKAAETFINAMASNTNVARGTHATS
ncbi:hypothetical protein TUMSATVNIG1_61050 (plasmid) [Vibrio nigripulchritudo]|uniref:hypothetical protein n=1 Tax=Vibrio nigripulchritudo TaxID=28173 RepID=UPI0019092EBF|nr:hypothetical protein [Vibrio nigripulchritudo]BCL74121.1 hypothetical protein VNTUMSATTG_60580 [Vibrio nigripulchritudo]BDU35496.1 hypothetical protein TUMSATVNIG1_61050 [Vibrio nigripulchritudo]